MNKINEITRSEELNRFAQLLLQNGFRILRSTMSEVSRPEIGPPSWFDYEKGGQIGHITKVAGSSCTYTIGWQHKPSRDWRTGRNFREGYEDILTLENAELCLQAAQRDLGTPWRPGTYLPPQAWESLEAFAADRRSWCGWEILDPIQREEGAGI